MESFSYVAAWSVYLLSAIILICVFWKMTRKLRLRRTRRSLRALIAVLLLTPINIGLDGSVWLAPAYLVGGYDWVLGHTDKAFQAGVYISSAYLLLIVIVMLESVMRRLLGMEHSV